MGWVIFSIPVFLLGNEWVTGHSKCWGLIHIVDECVIANEGRLAEKSCERIQKFKRYKGRNWFSWNKSPVFIMMHFKIILLRYSFWKVIWWFKKTHKAKQKSVRYFFFFQWKQGLNKILKHIPYLWWVDARVELQQLI